VIVLLTVGGETVVMQACRCCRVGVGVTRYPDGPVRHAECSFHGVVLPTRRTDRPSWSPTSAGTAPAPLPRTRTLRPHTR
jgi:hypothetical protein